MEGRSGGGSVHDTSKPNEDSWVPLVLVGVDTDREIDPIKKNKQ